MVRLLPIQYLPDQGRLTVHTSISMVIEGTTGYKCGDYPPARPSEGIRAKYRQVIADLVVNPAEVELHLPENPTNETRGADSGAYEYVIITHADWSSAVQDLADRRTRTGMPAKVVTHDWIDGQYGGTAQQQKIRNFITGHLAQCLCRDPRR